MDQQTKILWDFLDAAYRTGTIDKFMDLAGAATDKKYHNQATVFAELEDAICEMEDFSGVDDTLAEAFRQMPALTDEATLEGLGALVELLTPLVASAMANAGRDTEVLKQKKDKLLADLPKIARLLATLIALNAGALGKGLGGKSVSEYGQGLGRGMNAMAAFVNDLNRRDPAAVPDFMAGIFAAVDGKEMAEMADTVTQAFLDQDPPLLKFTASAVIKQAGKKVMGK